MTNIISYMENGQKGGSMTINEINTQLQNAMKSGDREQIKELIKFRNELMAKSTSNIKSKNKRKREREEELCGICQFPLSEPVEVIIKAGKWTASEQEKAECFSCATMTDAQYINSTNLDYSCLNSDGNIYSGSRRPGRTRDSFSHHHKFHKACIKKHLLTNDMVDFGFGPQDDLGSYLEKTCPICRDKCITRDLHRGWGYEAYQYRCSHQNCGMVEYFVSPEEARNYPQFDDYRKGLWVKQDNGNWLCKYHSGENNGMSCDAKDVYGTRENTTETFMTSCDYTPQEDTVWNFTQIAGEDDEESTSYITTCPHHKLLFCMENGVDETSCTETYKHFSNEAYKAYREALSNRGMLNFKCLNCDSWYTDKRAIPHSTHWEILCYNCSHALSFENLTLEQYGLDNVRFYCAEHINRIRCDLDMLTDNWCRNTRYLCGDEQWNRFVQETKATENNESYWQVNRDSRYFCPEHRRRIGQRNATFTDIYNVEQFGGMTNEGYIFESWDYEKSVVEDLYARIQNIENLIKNKTEMLEVQDMSLRDIERDDNIINWKKLRLDYLKELKHVLIVGKQETKRQQQAGEGKTSDDEEGSTTLNVYLAGKIPWYDQLLTEINGKINNSTPVKRSRAKGGKRKKKYKKNIRMRKKTRRKRGGEGKKSKKKLTWGKEPERFNTLGSHYENPTRTRHYDTLPTENKNMKTQQMRALIAMRRDADRKQKKLEKLAVAYTRRAKSRESKQKKRNPIKSFKKKIQKKLTLKNKSGLSNFQPDRERKGVKYTSLGGRKRRKRKKKTRKRRHRRKKL